MKHLLKAISIAFTSITPCNVSCSQDNHITCKNNDFFTQYITRQKIAQKFLNNSNRIVCRNQKFQDVFAYYKNNYSNYYDRYRSDSKEEFYENNKLLFVDILSSHRSRIHLFKNIIEYELYYQRTKILCPIYFRYHNLKFSITVTDNSPDQPGNLMINFYDAYQDDWISKSWEEVIEDKNIREYEIMLDVEVARRLIGKDIYIHIPIVTYLPYLLSKNINKMTYNDIQEILCLFCGDNRESCALSITYKLGTKTAKEIRKDMDKLCANEISNDNYENL